MAEEAAHAAGHAGFFTRAYDWTMAHKWLVLGGVGGLLGLYLLYKSSASAASAGTTGSGLSATQAAVDAAGLQANTQESGIAAQAQGVNEAAGVQDAEIQAELTALQAQGSTSTTNTTTDAQLLASINAANDATAIQLATIQANATAGTVAATPTPPAIPLVESGAYILQSINQGTGQVLPGGVLEGTPAIGQTAVPIEYTSVNNNDVGRGG